MSGSGRREYLSTVVDIAKKKGKKIVQISVGDKMYSKSDELGYSIPNGTILDTSERSLDYLRSAVFEEIIRMKDKTENLLVDTHACFRWHKHLTNAFDYYYLNKLDPDLYITITDSIYSIFGRLQTNQWKGKNNLAELLAWRDEEELLTRTFARIQRKKHFLIARNEPPETLYNLIFEPEIKKAYLSYPISGGEKEDILEVQKVRDELRKNLIIFDPLSIKDVEGLSQALALKKKGKKSIQIPFVDDDGTEKDTKILIEELEQVEVYLKDHTVARDYTLIKQSNFVIVYYYNPSLNSPGVQREMRYAKDAGKRVILYYPRATMSPFQEMDIARHFRDKNKFTRFLLKI